MKKQAVALLLVLCVLFSMAPLEQAVAAGEDWMLWSQSDSRWGDLSISSCGFERYTMRAQGCLVTAIAKILIHSGQQSPESFTPEDCLNALLDYEMLSTTGALLYGYRMNDEGFLDEYGPELTYFTDAAHEPWTEEVAYRNISALIAQNCYVIVRTYNQSSGSYHYMAVDRTENGSVYVMDNLKVIDLYATEKYNGVSDWLCFRYNGASSYPASGASGVVTPPPAPVVPEPPVGTLLNNFSQMAAYSDGIFHDVAAGDWYRDGVARSYELGLVRGQGNGDFGVGSSFTVAAALTLAARMHSIYNSGAADFEEGSPWYAVYADYAADYGIIAYGQFNDCNRPATRAELAQIFAAALPESALVAINTVQDGSIPDVPMDAPYAAAVYRLYRAGILTGGTGNHAYRPGDQISREEAACLAARVADLTLRLRFTMG